ncbi:MAG: O-methyltransferase [Candidatus Atabeyarchaeum deiterrae]
MRYEDILEYVQGLVGTGDDILAGTSERSDELRDSGVFQIDQSSGRLLELLARIRSPKRVLEIGSGAGYSALWLMKGMPPDGTLDAIELDPKVAQALGATIERAGLGGRIRIHQGRALDLLSKMKVTYDMVFIDANKDEYPSYLEQALRLTAPGSVILAHNMFMSIGTVNGKRSRRQKGITEYTRRIFNDHRLSSLVVPLGDGMALSYRVR